MSNSKISALTSATTPLAGTETLPIVQSSATKQVSITNLTAGRVVTMSGLGVGIAVPTQLVEIQAANPVLLLSASGTSGSGCTVSFKPGFSGTYGDQNIAAINAELRISGSTVGGTNAHVTTYSGGAERLRVTGSGNVGIGTTSPAALLDVFGNTCIGSLLAPGASTTFGIGGVADRSHFAGTISGTRDGGSYASTLKFYTLVAGGTSTEALSINSSQNVTVSIGNLIQGTSGKGVNFTANTPAAGMTSQLLNWYEEGTWTPNQGGGLTVVGAFSSTGRYTRNGRQMFVNGTITGATSVAIAAAGVLTANLPFTVNTNGAGHGNITNAANTAFSAVVCTSTNITTAGAIAATGTITFSATYIV